MGITMEWYEKNQSSLILSQLPVKQININTCTEDELKRHAYFDKNIAGILIKYRSNHGPFKSVSDIKNCAAVSKEFYQKVEPYIKVN
jgi:DNA uptake protein ComE-like DNA-binding protein